MDSARVKGKWLMTLTHLLGDCCGSHTINTIFFTFMVCRTFSITRPKGASLWTGHGSGPVINPRTFSITRPKGASLWTGHGSGPVINPQESTQESPLNWVDFIHQAQPAKVYFIHYKGDDVPRNPIKIYSSVARL
jgi:hypothetical protein